MNDIRQWLNGKRNYKEGVELYLKHGNDPQLKRLFTAEAESPFKKEKLISALDYIFSQDGSKKIVPGIPVKTQPGQPGLPPAETAPEKKWRTEDLHDDIERALYLRWKPLFAEMMNLVARIGDMARAGINDSSKKDEAGRMALRILDLDEECDELYRHRDHYLQHKKLPEEQKPIEISLDPLQWNTKLENHKKYVRRFKSQLQQDPANVDKAELLKKHEWAVEQYKKLLHLN